MREHDVLQRVPTVRQAAMMPLLLIRKFAPLPIGRRLMIVNVKCPPRSKADLRRRLSGG